MTGSPSGFDIDHAAGLLVRIYGRDAETKARKNADQRMLEGDAYGMLAWHLVAKAIEERAAPAARAPKSNAAFSPQVTDHRNVATAAKGMSAPL
jgi:hypothetical protein